MLLTVTLMQTFESNNLYSSTVISPQTPSEYHILATRQSSQLARSRVHVDEFDREDRAIRSDAAEIDGFVKDEAINSVR